MWLLVPLLPLWEKGLGDEGDESNATQPRYAFNTSAMRSSALQMLGSELA